MILQQPNQIIDINDWGEMAKEPFRQGSREKIRIRSPKTENFEFIKSNHPYLYKLSNPRYPWQFWNEVIAYRLGLLMGVPVPPAHIAINSQDNTAGALIEWFYDDKDEDKRYYFFDGGFFLQEMIDKFDKKTGKQHNFKDMWRIFSVFLGDKDKWLKEIIEMFCFDALIGNTDRHQENWGIIVTSDIKDSLTKVDIKLSPAFDNGTSLGHEILEDKLKDKMQNMESYIKKGYHHIRWELSSKDQIGHIEMIAELVRRYPQARQWLVQYLAFSEEKIDATLSAFLEFNNDILDQKYALTQQRIDFMIALTKRRRQLLLEAIHAAH
ncbi:MAG: HipA domain-containing protein [Candidatus Symbiobacter sp.]|nr:HipA domain-containing protein [Candidatus Symbiobacter sp.]